MMADRIEVETLKEGKEPRKVEIENYSDYFVTRKGSRTEQGTTITLFLKDDAELDMIEELKKYARHVEFPVYVDDGENAETIVDQGYDFNFVDYMETSYKQYADELKPYVIDFEKEGIEGVKGKIFFMFLKDGNGSYGFKSEHLSLSAFSSYFKGVGFLSYFARSWRTSMEDEMGKHFLSQDGILIQKIETFSFPLRYLLPDWLDTPTIFFDINLEDESKLDLTTDRNNAVANDKFGNLLRKMDNIINNNIKSFFSQIYPGEYRYKIIEIFISTFVETIRRSYHISLEKMIEVIIWECSVHGERRYLTYGELKDHWSFFYFLSVGGLRKTFRNITPEDMKKAIEKAYPKGPVVFSGILNDYLLEFSGERIIVTNKQLGFSVDKYLLVPSAEKRDKKEKAYGYTFEGDYKDCFGTLTTQHFRIEPNINHPFIRLVNKNRDKSKGNDKKDHEFFIDKLLNIEEHGCLKPLKEIQSIQKYLLDFYMEKGILTKEEVEMYVLTEKDFCPYDMGEDFLKQ
jgi:hypothetical protein